MLIQDFNTVFTTARWGGGSCNNFAGSAASAEICCVLMILVYRSTFIYKYIILATMQEYSYRSWPF